MRHCFINNSNNRIPWAKNKPKVSNLYFSQVLTSKILGQLIFSQFRITSEGENVSCFLPKKMFDLRKLGFGQALTSRAKV